MTPAPACCSKRPLRKIIRARCSDGGLRAEGRGGPKDRDAAKAYYRRAADLGDEQAKAALKRLDCPIAIKDKRGKPVTDLCF